MLLGFKRQFAPSVRGGSKQHTIRGIRKILPRVGEICHCYVDPRQKTMALLGRWPCVKVESIRIKRGRAARPLKVWIDGVELDNSEVEALFRRDGFRDTGTPASCQAAQFWKQRLPFKGYIIHWNYNVPADARKKQRGTGGRSVITSTRAVERSRLTKT